MHHVLTGQLLHLLEDAHHAHVVQEGLDINNEPEASYIPEKRALLERLKTKKSEQFKKLVVSVQPVAVSQQPNPPVIAPPVAAPPVVANPTPPPPPTQPALPTQGLPAQPHLDNSLPDDLQSGCSNFTSASRMSQGPAILQKLKNNKSRQQSRITAVEAVVNHLNLGKDANKTARILTKARVSWRQLDELRYQYETLLDEAFSILGEHNTELAAELATNDDRNTWIESVESKLEEMLLLKDSPEKTAADATTLIGLNTVQGPNNLINHGFHTVPGRLPPMHNPGQVTDHQLQAHCTRHKL